jgi:uncharacterized protein (TIGR00290 family)
LVFFVTSQSGFWFLPGEKMKPKILLAWSSGKDSAWALHVLRREAKYEIAGLFTTINSHFDRVAMHGTRRALVELQAEAAGLPLAKIPLPWPCSNEEYERAMSAFCEQAVKQGVTALAFGDLFLEDIRAYRVRQLEGTGLQPVFPVWQIPTTSLAEEMIAGGLRARLVCVDPKALPANFAGREFDRELLRDLPKEVDPCGENGEFHSFVYAGPMFDREIPVKSGERVLRDGFWYADLLPG